MNKAQVKNVAKNALSGALVAGVTALAQQALNGKTVGGRKIVLFTASK